MISQYEDALYEDPKLARFYGLDNSLQRADYAVYLQLASSASHILDLGCGTGTLLTAIAEQYPHTTLVGVDPAQAMLDIAQQKTNRVRWVNSTAEALCLDMKFDLIILSGHAFQVFLTQEQRIAALQTMQQHLTADGTIVFDSRNPAVEEWREWTPELSRESLSTQEFGEVILWNDVAEQNGIVRYQTFYQQGENGPIYRAESDIAFPTLSDITQAAEFCGLRVRYLYGDWQFNAFQENSPEMVFTLEHTGSLSVKS
jgi:ubiquinone/menaquinone biosynthesis C-methylase UbiE